MATVTQMVVNGKGVANQFVHILDGGDLAFQSYNSIIAQYNPKSEVLEVADVWSYSKTTSKYFGEFVNRFTSFNYSGKTDWQKQIIRDNKIIPVEELKIN